MLQTNRLEFLGMPPTAAPQTKTFATDDVARPVPTIFHEPWWMDIACAGNARETIVMNENQIVGRLPYAYVTRFPRLRMIGMPQMAHVLGPAYAPQYAKPELRSLKQLAITRKLIAQLPRVEHIFFRMHGGISDTLAFGEAGFQTGVDFTVEIVPAPVDAMWRAMRDKTRNVIRRAQEQYVVNECTDPAEFLTFYESNLKERGLKNEYDADQCVRVVKASIQRGSGRVIVARDAAGTPRGGLFTVWDNTAAYYFMSTRAKSAMNGVINLLIWHAIQHAAARNLKFDMDFLHVKRNNLPNHLLLTGFGGAIKPRFTVSRTSPMWRAARQVCKALYI